MKTYWNINGTLNTIKEWQPNCWIQVTCPTEQDQQELEDTFHIPGLLLIGYQRVPMSEHATVHDPAAAFPGCGARQFVFRTSRGRYGRRSGPTRRRCTLNA